MNLVSRLNPFNWGGDKRQQGQLFTNRQVSAMGPATSALNDWVFREVAPRLYEALREAIPPIDAAINRLVTLDGILRMEAETDALQREMEAFAEGVQVNDLQTGLQAAYASQGNEMYEQGFGIATYELGDDGIKRIRIGDSKGVYFKRNDQGELETWYRKPSAGRGRRDGTDNVERVLRNSYQSDSVASLLDGHGYKRLDPSRLIYAGLHNEADNPYGTSLMRSMEFVSRVLLTIDNAQLQTWERFGNPVFNVKYKTKARLTEDQLETRRSTIATNLKNAMEAKGKGNAVDFVNAIGANDEMEITVLGADGQVLEIEQPARHVLEQIVAKTGLPSWLLGFHWSTAERLAERQGEILLQESRTRFTYRRSGLMRIMTAHLRSLGMTWNPGDWTIEQELPSLQDIVAMAQANFLEAQTELMRSNAGTGEQVDAVRGARVTRSGKVRLPTDEDYQLEKSAPPHQAEHHGHKQEDFVETDPNLPAIELATEQALLDEWSSVETQVRELLGLPEAKSLKQEGPVFIFDHATMLQPLLDLERDFVATAGAEEGEFAKGMFEAWLRGLENASDEFDTDSLVAIEDAVRETNRQALATRGLDLVRNASARALRDDIIDSLAEGVFDGQNVYDAARALKNRFAAHDVDWVRLARSEISQAQADGKMAQYAAMEISEYNWAAPPDGCPICKARETGGPYTVGTGPLPMKDSHPNCRCTVKAVV